MPPLACLETVFYLTQPVRETLQDVLPVCCYISLLRCSWTLYSSHNRQGAESDKKLRLSPLFFDHCLLRPSVSETEFTHYLIDLYERIKSQGCFLTLRSRPGNLAKVPFACVYLHAPGSFAIKLYEDGLNFPCTLGYSNQNSLLEMQDGSPEKRHAQSIDEIVNTLRTHNIIAATDGRLHWFDEELYSFAFDRRIELYWDAHHKAARAAKIGRATLFQRFFNLCHQTN